jgi:hypothetical protein
MDKLYLTNEAATNAIRTAIPPQHDGADTSSRELCANFPSDGIGNSVKRYYSDHVQALRDSLDVFTKQGFAPTKDMEYLDNGMAQWAKHESEIPKAFAARTAFYATGDLSGYFAAARWSVEDSPKLRGLNQGVP